MRINTNQGFTMIELIMVIVILGILAATALPKFADFSTDARTAVYKGVKGGLTSATSIAHAKWLVKGKPTSTTIAGTTVYFTSNGWAEDIVAPVASGTTTTTGCLAVWNNLFSNPPIANAGTCVGSCEYLVAVGVNTCTYTDVDSNTITYNVLTGSIS